MDYLLEVISKSFSHFWKKAGLPECISFRHLRKTYCTRMFLAAGAQAQILTGHSHQEILNRHYINKELVARVVAKADIFPELQNGSGEMKRKNVARRETTRRVEIQKIRAAKEARDITPER